ncbi:MAG: adenine deaminase [Rikenellaceae bacterium]
MSIEMQGVESKVFEGQIVDLQAREIFSGRVTILGGVIESIERCEVAQSQGYIMPGFVDSHVHIESSMMIPENFAKVAVRRGTVAVVSDPHEIANVMGREGVDFMVSNAEYGAIKCFFTIPSSVPATPFDVAGGVISVADVEEMAASGDFVALSEVMNAHGVVNEYLDTLAKISAAVDNGLVVDGHAPMLSGDDLTKYVASGISTDHECSNEAEALEKIAQGMKILIREGSAAKNYDALKSLLASNPESVMFCTDDISAADLTQRGEIDYIVKRAIADGYDIFDVLRAACVNGVDHYDLSVGQLVEGDSADFIVVEDLKEFKVSQVYVDGECQYNSAESVEADGSVENFTISLNNFERGRVTLSSLMKEVSGTIDVIQIIPNEIVTERFSYTPDSLKPNMDSDLENDILKIVYINRYDKESEPQVAFCRGFGLKRGAIATSVSHDSHNIIAVGCSDMELAMAINHLIDMRGGMSVCEGGLVETLPLPIGGIMSDQGAEKVVEEYDRLRGMVQEMGSELPSPFMTLSFMALVVIPSLKIGERGLFDYQKFGWVE